MKRHLAAIRDGFVRVAGRGRWWRLLVGAVGGYLVAFPLHDKYPGLYVLVIVAGVFLTIWLFVRTGKTPEQVLAEHHERELERTTDDSALLMELRDMFEARACDWPMLSAVTHLGKLCPTCGHIAFHHDVPTKVCEKCHAPGE